MSRAIIPLKNLIHKHLLIKNLNLSPNIIQYE
jgi:hypothetical protein